MKNIIPILLIIVVLLISFMASMSNKEEVPDYIIDLEKEYRENKLLEKNLEDNLCEGNAEMSSGSSSLHIEGLELILEYLSPDAMVEYDSYMNAYADGIISLLDEDEDFYNANKATIGNVFGIYDYVNYSKFVKAFSDIDKISGVEYIKINNIEEEGGLLKTNIKIYFSNESVDIIQLLSYVYVENKPMLFIYTKV